MTPYFQIKQTMKIMKIMKNKFKIILKKNKSQSLTKIKQKNINLKSKSRQKI